MKPEKYNDSFDLIVIGGGITGAGVLREAVRMGLKTLLVEKNDFAYQTSSRSSKLVHGGLRYLRQGQLHLTYESVRQRQRLLEEAPGLVEEIEFLIPIYKDKQPGRAPLMAGLTLYDAMAGKRNHRHYNRRDFLHLVPEIDSAGLSGGYLFMDAQTDDARLVLRLINEAAENGGQAMNYTAAVRILKDENGYVAGIEAKNSETGQLWTFAAPAVINATGAWAEALHPVYKSNMHLRPLRGSHLVIDASRLNLSFAVTLMHPDDGRPLFIIPWEGALLLGTTDIDHDGDINREIRATAQEARYMIECLRAYFPDADIGLKDCISSFAGIRPVLGKKGTDPSGESREHAIWEDKGLVTITGGKLTTFRILAEDSLKAAAPWLALKSQPEMSAPAFALFSQKNAENEKKGLSAAVLRRLYGRYGRTAHDLISNAAKDDLCVIPGTHTLWAELLHAAKTESVCHLSDLLLRRVRIGMLLPNGAARYLDCIQKLCEPVLGWDETRWIYEKRMYMDYVKTAYRVPE